MIDARILARKILEWIEEDAPFGDITTRLVIPRDARVRGEVVVKSEWGIASCVEEIAAALNVLGIDARPVVGSGSRVSRGDVVMVLEGYARDVLLVERTVLNLLMMLFGIATATHAMVVEARSVNPRVRIAATRKTPPGLRELVKLAVAHGGGDTHRFSLSDAIIIKDNHIAVVGSVRRAIELARAGKSFIHRIEVEVSSAEQGLEAAEAGADVVMLDNVSPQEVSRFVKMLELRGLRDRVLVEASGGIDLRNVREYAAADPDVISSSFITMRAPPIDMSLEVRRI